MLTGLPVGEMLGAYKLVPPGCGYTTASDDGIEESHTAFESEIEDDE